MTDRELGAERLLLCVLYKGPWEYVTSWLYNMHKVDANGNLGPKHEVADDSLRGRLAEWADRRDWAWREKYVRAGKRPHSRWKRRDSDNN